MADEEQKMIFSKNLNKYLSESKKTQKEIADAIGVSPQTFNTWCKGIALPRMGKVQALADYFGINKSDLIDEKNTAPTLTPRDERDIKRDLDNLMDKLAQKEYGPAAYDGEELSPEAAELFRDELEIALKRLKLINKEKYNPHKNGK